MTLDLISSPLIALSIAFAVADPIPTKSCAIEASKLPP